MRFKRYVREFEGLTRKEYKELSFEQKLRIQQRYRLRFCELEEMENIEAQQKIMDDMKEEIVSLFSHLSFERQKLLLALARELVFKSDGISGEDTYKENELKYKFKSLMEKRYQMKSDNEDDLTSDYDIGLPEDDFEEIDEEVEGPEDSLKENMNFVAEEG